MPRSAHTLLTVALAATLLGSAAPVAAQSTRGDRNSSPTSFPDEGMRSQFLMRQHVFFPPVPPALGRPVNRVPAPSDGRPAAPRELAPYVNEIFYPMLAARYSTRSLKDPQRRQLDAYRANKLALQRELTAELQRLQGAEPAARAAALAQLARAQAPRLTQLENDAEALRRELYLSEHTWGAVREWRLGDRDRRGFSPIEIAHVMRSYAFFQHGLLPAQRRLLREIAMELLLAAEDQEKATANQPHVFFPPEPARVSFPDDIPAEAARLLAEFQTRKSTLKKELYDAIYRHDGELLGFLKGNTIGALVTKQSARLEQLEKLAEDVRRALPTGASARPAAPPTRSPLPAALQERLALLLATYAEAQKAAVEKIDAILAAAAGLPLQSSIRFDADGLKFVVVPTRMAGRQPEVLRRIEGVRAEISAVAEDYGRKLAELLNERTAIREEAGRQLGVADATKLEATMMTAVRSSVEQQSLASYDEYRLAVFEPGLSPAQRRILFDRVMEQFDLPLPRGELQPVRRGNSW